MQMSANAIQGVVKAKPVSIFPLEGSKSQRPSETAGLEGAAPQARAPQHNSVQNFFKPLGR